MRLFTSVCVALLVGAAVSGPVHAQEEDPYLWLEDVRGDRPMAWVKERNDEMFRELQATPDFQPLHDSAAKILGTVTRLPAVTRHGTFVYNFWTDANHGRGIWRRTTLQQYRRTAPAWETVIDLDQLGAEEGEKWVWHGAECLAPKAERCLVMLSRGGGDAHVVREFDTVTRRFVDDGFALPDGKSQVKWLTRDTLLVAADAGPGSLTKAGYPRVIREWRRGTPFGQAVTVFEGQDADMSVQAETAGAAGHERQFVVRSIDYYRTERHLREGGKLTRIDLPADAGFYLADGQMLVQLGADWEAGGKRFPQGALLATDFRRFLDGGRAFDVLFTPTPTSSLSSVTVLRSAVLLTISDNVKYRLVEASRKDGAWRQRKVAVPAIGRLEVAALDPVATDDYVLTTQGFVTPTATYLGHVGSTTRTLLKATSAFFDPAPYKVEQFSATSKDGTRVPYFVVMNRHAKLDGSNPTILNGYGGFQIPMEPYYLGVQGAAWLEKGGVFVLANIRGGGEFGPQWHTAAIKEHRQRAFDDFIAVAENLIERRITSPRHLGITGRSNGGLLVGAALTQRPDLFGAAVCQVPLLDMRRYSKLLAGPSWMAEYGDPDDPAQWAYLRRYSPYHNVAKDRHYPRVLFTASTTDDRVHPGHARKMVARMQEQGHDVLYWENTEGGHSSVASLEQEAQMWTIIYSFMLQQLR